jgi:hypothetical protein
MEELCRREHDAKKIKTASRNDKNQHKKNKAKDKRLKGIPLAEAAYPLDKAVVALCLCAFCLAQGICDRKASEDMVQLYEDASRTT